MRLPAALVPVATVCSVEVDDDRVRSLVERGLQAVDQVHGVPAGSPPLRVLIEEDSVEDPNAVGGYEVADPPVIRLAPEAADPAFTLAHELGHYIDHRVLGGHGGWASTTPELDEWWGAVEESQIYRALGEMYWDPPSIVVDGVRVQADPDDLDYFREVEELFARSYSQYIAVRSRDEVLLEDLANAPSRLYPEQWPEDDFAMIAMAFDRLLENRAWSR